MSAEPKRLSKRFTGEPVKAPTIAKRDRPEAVRLLKAAKEQLWDGIGSQPRDKSWCICAALHAVDWSSRVSSKLREIIMFRLGEWAVLDGWLFENVSDYNGDKAKTQATRRAWIDSLIEEFSK